MTPGTTSQGRPPDAAPLAPILRLEGSARVARVAGAAAAALARWESGLAVDEATGRELFASHGLSGLEPALRREIARQGGDAQRGLLIASQRATESVSVATLRRGAARGGVQSRVRTRREVGRLRLRGWRQRRRLGKAVTTARRASARVARDCRRGLRRSRSTVEAVELRTKAFVAITEICANAWRAIESTEAGAEDERLKRRIEEIQRVSLERVRAFPERTPWYLARERVRAARRGAGARGSAERR